MASKFSVKPADVTRLSILPCELMTSERTLSTECSSLTEGSQLSSVCSQLVKLTVAVVTSDFGDSVGAGVLILEDLDQLLCLLLSFLLCNTGVSLGRIQT
jgi:hypothetical protein